MLIVVPACVVAVVLATGGGASVIGAVANSGPSATAGPPPMLAVALRRGMGELVQGDPSGVGWDSGNGLWGGHAPPNWWQSALAIQTVLRYLDATHDPNPIFEQLLVGTYKRNVYRPRSPAPRDFALKFMDDTAWWGLAWLDATRYELEQRHDATDAARFLAVAEYDARYVEAQPKVCGGIPWQRGYPPDTITSAEFAALAAKLSIFRSAAGPFHDAQLASLWLGEAKQAMDWLQRSRLIDLKTGRVLDRINAACNRYIGGPMTYTQGEVAEALVQIGNALHNRAYYDQAARFLRFAISPSSGLTWHGILQDHCEATPGDCQDLHDHLDFPAFKGVFINAVADWSAATGSSEFAGFLRTQAIAVLRNATRISQDSPQPCATQDTCQFTLGWRVSVDPSREPPHPTVATQMSALDALIAELRQPKTSARSATAATKQAAGRHRRASAR